MNGYFLLVFIIVVAGDSSLPGSPRKDESKNTQSTLVNQRKPEIAGAFEVDMVDALHINERSTFGWRNDDANALCIVSAGAKDSSEEVD